MDKKEDSAESWSERLMHEHMTLAELQKFRVVVSSCGKTWLKTFEENSGMVNFTKAFINKSGQQGVDQEVFLLFSAFQFISLRPRCLCFACAQSWMTEFVRCCRSMVNSEDGLQMALTQHEASSSPSERHTILPCYTDMCVCACVC